MAKRKIKRRRAAKAPVALRATILERALDETMHAANEKFGDPLATLAAAARLKNMYWLSFNTSLFQGGKVAPHGQRKDDRFGGTTPHGSAIDMILNKLAHIACSPSIEVLTDQYRAIAIYAAIAAEVADRT